MLFNSWLFIFIFLPAFLLAFYISSKSGEWARIVFFCFSLVFYVLWGWQYFLLFGVLIGMNYLFGRAMSRCAERPKARRILAAALVLNILPLAWFKYSWFLAENISLLFDLDWRFTPPGLPAGISFYTFIQIAWLAGIYRGQFRLPDPLSHAIFSAGFPWVISGPIVRYDQLGPQLRAPAPLEAAGLASGLTLFGLGLGKKCLLADSLGPFADAVFNAAEKNWPLSCPEAWLGSFCYTFQLYFDFSGYTDMALGLGLMIGLRLPENFNSPYKSTGIIDFWRRWHITLGTWLRDFLYIPLGGNRKGRFRQYANLFLTMLIAGIWHGSGWTFMIWGGLHGFMLVVNHAFRALTKTAAMARWLSAAPVRAASILLTFLAVSVCWVIFRAFSLDGALAMLRAMFPPEGMQPGGAAWFPNRHFTSWIPFALVAASAFICWLMPNSGQIMRGESGMCAWRANPAWAYALAGLFFGAVVLAGGQTGFLYFQF